MWSRKKSKYGRHQISPPMLIEAPITKENYFWGRHTDGRADILRKRGGGSHVMLERGNLAGSSGGTRNSHKKCQLLGMNFDQFMVILMYKKIYKKKQFWRSEILQEARDTQEFHIKNKFNFRCEIWLIYGNFSGLKNFY